jgi:hypothetical protein
MTTMTMPNYTAKDALRAIETLSDGAPGHPLAWRRSIDTLRAALQIAGPLADIAVERRGQMEREGYTLAHDDTHDRGELAAAAAAFAAPNICRPTQDRRRDLVKAGALIVAEIERLDRIATDPTVALPLSSTGGGGG